ncbi:unnamed protein product, partial [Allacma fusca]
GKNIYQRVDRYPAQNLLYPNMVGFGASINTFAPKIFVGHGILLSSRVALTSATSFDAYDKEALPIYFVNLYKPVVNSLKRHKNYKEKKHIWCHFVSHPNFNRTTKAHNLGLVIFSDHVISPDKIVNMTFAKQGQTFKGPCKYQSWGKLKFFNNIYAYTDDLLEAKLEILSDHECLETGRASTHFCTKPVLCGLNELIKTAHVCPRVRITKTCA